MNSHKPSQDLWICWSGSGSVKPLSPTGNVKAHAGSYSKHRKALQSFMKHILVFTRVSTNLSFLAFSSSVIHPRPVCVMLLTSPDTTHLSSGLNFHLWAFIHVILRRSKSSSTESVRLNKLSFYQLAPITLIFIMCFLFFLLLFF